MWKNILMFLLTLLVAMLTITGAAYVAFWSDAAKAKQIEPAHVDVIGISSAKRAACEVYGRFAAYVLENRDSGSTKEDVTERSVRAAKQQALAEDQITAIVEIIETLWPLLATPLEASQAVYSNCMKTSNI